MTTELRLRSQSQRNYVHALSQVYRNGVQIYDPSLWLVRDPDAEEKMLRDADIAHAVGFRRHLIAGRQWTCVPRDEGSETGDLAVTVATDLINHIQHFTQARLNLARAFFSGSRFSWIHGEPRVLTIGDGKPRTWWVPTRLEDFDKRFFRIVSQMDEQKRKVAAHWERWDIVKSDFVPLTGREAIQLVRHVYQDDQATLGHGRALREALGWWWYAKTHVFQESLAAVEKFAQGQIKISIDGLRDASTDNTNQQLIDDYVAKLEDMRARHILAHDSSDSIEVLQGSAEGWQLMHTMREELRSTIFTLVLGANLTTAANEGGSYALAEIQENSTEALIQYDRETLEETLTDDLVGCLWFHNHANLVELGVAKDKPRFSITQEKRQDPQERATVAQTLNQMGVAIAADDLYEQTGFRKPDPDEDVIEGAAAPAPGGFGGLFGNGAPAQGSLPFGGER